MRRREFITVVVGAAAWPRAAGAQQQPAMPMVAILSSASLSAFADLLGAFRQGLKETGYVEGQNVAIESRWAEGHFERLPELATELLQQRPAVIVTTGDSSNLAARAATSTVPHVFLSQDDPVRLGLVTSFNRPGSNATGMSLLTSALVAKRLEFIRQLVPAGAPISYLMNPQAPGRVSLERCAGCGTREWTADQCPKRRQRRRYRQYFHRARPTRRCADREHRSVLRQPASSNHRAGGIPQNSDYL